MTARELIRHCFPWEIRPGVAAPEEDLLPAASPAEAGPEAVAGDAPAGDAEPA